MTLRQNPDEGAQAAPLPDAPDGRLAPAIKLRGISKAFGQVQANDNIDLTVARGTIHGIIGENGAGKSTLMSILYGFYRPDAGRIEINGSPVDISDSQAAIKAGIGMVFQHFKLVQNFTVLENIILGAEDGPFLRPSLARARRELLTLSQEYGLAVDPDALIENLSVGHQQRVEILKALYRRAEILILDEPTGVLTPAEADHLFRILKGLRDEGKTIILITHKLREIMETTDNVSVMRRGQMVSHFRTTDTTREELAEAMVGRKVLLQVEKTPAKPAANMLEVSNLSMTDGSGVKRLHDISITLRAGEILGLAGVSGNGQTELMQILGGYSPEDARLEGGITLDGSPLPLTGRHANGASRRASGIAHIPEDRQLEGLIMDFTVWENVAFGYQDDPALKSGPLMNRQALRADSQTKVTNYDVRPPDINLPVRNFSGGNQQKIVVAREIERNPKVLLVGQPTRGVDIGAIEFIHKQLIALRDAGCAILLVSVELDEIMSLSDRIAVICGGALMGERRAEETTASELGLMMAGAAD